MKPPNEFELKHLLAAYDPVKAHEYYVRNRKLKGRKPGKPDTSEASPRTGTVVARMDPRTGKTRQEIHQGAKARQKKELSERIDRLSDKLQKLEARIKERIHEEASENRKGKAKKERAAKEADKPKSAAEKAEDARESKKYRDKHKQELKSKGEGSSDKKKGSKKHSHSISELKSLATKVKGQIAVAKQKLAAL